MRSASDAQARLLSKVHDRTDPEYGDRRFISTRGTVFTHSATSGYILLRGRFATVRACIAYGWLEYDADDGEAWVTEDGVIALGVWQQRAVRKGPPPLPTLSERERQIVALAQRAHELGYVLCARKPVRVEANRLRRAGWFRDCWVANSATGLVPTSMAVVEVFPDAADRAATSTAAQAATPAQDEKDGEQHG